MSNTSSYKPLVSIITPTYNHEKYITDCIESVISQTYSNWEQIIINDGSTDNTEEIIQSYTDKRIKYISQDNVGIWNLAQIYNKALHKASGELIAVLEGDDFWPAEKLEIQLPCFKNKKIVMSFGKATVTNAQGKPLHEIPLKLQWPTPSNQNAVFRLLFKNNFIPACTVICRKKTLESLGGFYQPDVHCVDYPTWLKMSMQGEIFYYNNILGYWRRHEKQVSSNITPEIIQQEKKFKLSFYDSLPEETKKIVDITPTEIENIYRKKLADFEYYQGRIYLYNHNIPAARSKFYQALKEGDLKIQSKSLCGLTCSYLHTDLEWLMRLFGVPTLDGVFQPKKH